MFCRDARLSRLRDERIARLYSKSLLLRILFVVLNDFWISNDDFGLEPEPEVGVPDQVRSGQRGQDVDDVDELRFGEFAVQPDAGPDTQRHQREAVKPDRQSFQRDDGVRSEDGQVDHSLVNAEEGHLERVDKSENKDRCSHIDFFGHLLRQEEHGYDRPGSVCKGGCQSGGDAVGDACLIRGDECLGMFGDILAPYLEGDKGDRQQADDQVQVVCRKAPEELCPDDHADDDTRQQEPEVFDLPLLPVGVHAEDIPRAEQRQQDADSLGAERDHTDGCDHHAQSAAESRFGKSNEKTAQSRQQIGQV